MLLVSARRDPSQVTAAVRAALREADRGAVFYDISPLSELVDRQTSQSRFTSWLMAVFAGLALLLAMIGIYGVMSYAVTRRTQEIGIRMALGAARSDVLRLVAASGVGLIAGGLIAGVGGALLLTRLIEGLLYGVKPGDPLTLAAAAASLAGVGLAACLIPAVRAGRIAPAVALRDE
jgi:putative ABC transport system permease protein